MNNAIPAMLADAYIPLLAIACLIRCMHMPQAWKWRLPQAIATNLFIAWGLMAIDSQHGIWRAWSLDYSTHAAVALALVLCLACSRRSQAPVWGGSLIAYALLMEWLRYHSKADVMTTVIAAGILMLPASIWLLCRRGKEDSAG